VVRVITNVSGRFKHAYATILRNNDAVPPYVREKFRYSGDSNS